jgi:hypothetical protein
VIIQGGLFLTGVSAISIVSGLVDFKGVVGTGNVVPDAGGIGRCCAGGIGAGGDSREAGGDVRDVDPFKASIASGDRSGGATD